MVTASSAMSAGSILLNSAPRKQAFLWLRSTLRPRSIARLWFRSGSTPGLAAVGRNALMATPGPLVLCGPPRPHRPLHQPSPSNRPTSRRSSMLSQWNRGDFRGYMEGFANPTWCSSRRPVSKAGRERLTITSAIMADRPARQAPSSISDRNAAIVSRYTLERPSVLRTDKHPADAQARWQVGHRTQSRLIGRAGALDAISEPAPFEQVDQVSFQNLAHVWVP